MKSTVRVVTGAILALVCGAAGAETIALPPPMLNSRVTVSKALQDRRSIRDFSEEPVSDRFLSGVLWKRDGAEQADHPDLRLHEVRRLSLRREEERT